MADIPQFSIIIPTQNRAEMCLRAVRSVLAQSYTSFELLVLDDCSNTQYCWPNDVLEDRRVQLLFNNSIKGPAGTRNYGFENARGHLIALLDDDDEYLPTFLDATYKEWQDAMPRVGVTWCGINSVSDVNHDYSDPAGRLLNFDTKSDRNDEKIRKFLSVGTGYGICISRNCLASVGGFEETVTTVEDTDWFLRIVANGFLPQRVPGTHVCVHDHNEPKLTHSDNNYRNLIECEWLLEQHRETFMRFPYLERQILQHMENVRTGAGAIFPYQTGTD